MNVAAHKSAGQHASCLSSRLRKYCHYYICSGELRALLGDEAIPALLDVVVARLLPPPPSEADLGRKYNGKERKAVPAVLAYRHYEANGGDPPAPFTGKYACFENVAYRELLNKHGQPCNANPAAKAAFLTRFRYRSWPSISAHPNKFNLDEYKEWRGGDKDKWVGFQWRLLGD